LKIEFQKLNRLRFDERNRKLIGSFTQAKQHMNARGLLNSTETIKEMHLILEQEFIDSVSIITDTAMDAIKRKNILIETDKILVWCIEELKNRKIEIEGLLLSNNQSIRDGLQNSVMIEPYMSLDNTSALQDEEIAVMLTKKMDSHLKNSGGNLLSIIKNRFFNIPLIVWGMIIIASIIAISNFTDALGKIKVFFIN